MRFLTLILALTLAGCQGWPPAAQSPAAGAEQTASTQQQATALTTRLEAYVRSVTQKLESGAISRDRAIHCRAQEDQLRRDIEAAANANDALALQGASARLDLMNTELEAK